VENGCTQERFWGILWVLEHRGRVKLNRISSNHGQSYCWVTGITQRSQFFHLFKLTYEQTRAWRIKRYHQFTMTRESCMERAPVLNIPVETRNGLADVFWVSRKLRPRKLRPQTPKTQTPKTQTPKTQTPKTQTPRNLSSFQFFSPK